MTSLHIDYVERRDSCPRLSRQQVEDALDEERYAERAAAYERHVNEACRAIHSMPASLVNAAYIGQVLDALTSKASSARLEEVAESLGILSDQVTP